MPVALVLDSLRSAFNVGNIFRLAEATRAQEVVTCGYTATPPHPKLAKTARGCDSLVPHRHAESVTGALESLRSAGFAILAVETAVGAQSVWDVRFPFPTALVLGNEALGISNSALEACDGVLQLPCFGRKNSVNVANCAAVVLYAALRQWLEEKGGEVAAGLLTQAGAPSGPGRSGHG